MLTVCLRKLGSNRRVHAIAAKHICGATGRDNLKAQLFQHLGVNNHIALIVVSHRHENLSLGRQRRTRTRLGLRKGGIVMGIKTHNLAGRAHFWAEQRINHHTLRGAEAAKRQNRSLNRDRGILRQRRAIHAIRQMSLRFQLGNALPQTDHHGRLRQLHAGRLRNKRNGAGSTRVRLNHEQILRDVGKLNINQAPHTGAACNSLGCFLNLGDHIGTQGNWRQSAGRIAGVNAGLLNMLHHTAQVELGAVEERIHINLDSVFQELIDKRGLRGRNLGRIFKVACKVRFIIDDLHAAPAQHIGGTNQHRVPNLVGNTFGTLEGICGTILRRNQTTFLQHARELTAVLSQVNSLGSSTQNRDPGIFEGLRKLQRGLATQLHKNTQQTARAAL